jgi:glycerate kinase
VTILIAPDKFKGSLTATQVCDAITEGARKFDATINIISLPLADGGDGTCDILTSYSKGKKVTAEVEDPLRRSITCEYGISNDGQTAFIEMAKASGLQLLNVAERNPTYTTTYGTGQLILAAIRAGVRKLIMGIGGSATNDAGIGMAHALGFGFFSGESEIEPIGKNLVLLTSISRESVPAILSQCSFTVLCDVKNPLSGKNGAAQIFAAQKGASRNEIDLLDAGLRQFQKVAEAEFRVSLDFPGAGAAGGLGAGARAFLRANMKGGFDFVADFIQLEQAIRKADLIVTGEGSIDEQSLSGKVVQGVAAIAKKHRKQCVAFAGRSDLPPKIIARLNLSDVVSLQNAEVSQTDSMANAYPLLVQRAFEYLSGSKR